MRWHISALLSLLLAPSELFTAAPQFRETESRLSLLLRIREIPETGIPRDCSDSNPQCSADIKSTLEITPDLTRLPNRPPVTPVVDELDSQRREQLNIALDGLNRSLQLSTQIIAAINEPRVPEIQLDALSDQ